MRLSGSIHLSIVGPFLRQRFLYRLHDSEPHGLSLHVTGSKTLGGPENVEVGGHGAPEFTFETCSCGSHGELPQ